MAIPCFGYTPDLEVESDNAFEETMEALKDGSLFEYESVNCKKFKRSKKNYRNDNGKKRRWKRIWSFLGFRISIYKYPR